MISESTKTKFGYVPKGKLNKDLKSFSNDPFFMKKAAEAKAFLEKNGFPEDAANKR